MRTKQITTVLTVLFGLSGALLAGTALTQEAKPDATQVPAGEQSERLAEDDATMTPHMRDVTTPRTDDLADDTATPRTDDLADDTATPRTDDLADDTATPSMDRAADQPGTVTRSFGTSTEPFTGTVLRGMTTDELIGMNVVDSAGDKVGSVSDLLIGADNIIDRAVIDVGGFLGFGTKPVVIELDQLNVAEGDDEVVLAATREELDAMPEWQRSDHGWQINN